MRSPRAGDHAEGGFMLVELLVVISLMAIVGGLLSDAIVSAFHSQRDITARATDLDSLRQAMERTTRDMRGADAVCDAETQKLELEALNNAGASTLFTWYVAPVNGGSSLIETQSPDSGCIATTSAPTSTATVLTNLDPATALFGYTPKPGYTPVVPEDGFCTVISTGKIAIRCVGAVGIDLKALLPGHPDLELADTVQLRNVQ